MATLREAVGSGRRWRLKRWGGWYGPGTSEAGGFDVSISEAISPYFEIEPEPEPEKPREYWLHLTSGIEGFHEANGQVRTPAGKMVRVHDADVCDRLRGAK